MIREAISALGFSGRFRRKKKQQVVVEPVKPDTSELEKFIGDDKETYEMLRQTMFLDPRKIDVSLKDAIERAKRAEKEKSPEVVTQLYEIAGGLAIYQGDVEKVAEYFGKCAELSPQRNYPILKNPEKAVAKAQEYYKHFLKT